MNKLTFDGSGYASRICAGLQVLGLEIARIGTAVDQHNLQERAQELRVCRAKLEHIKTEVDYGINLRREHGPDSEFVPSVSFDVAEERRVRAVADLDELLKEFDPKTWDADENPEDIAGTLGCFVCEVGLDLASRDHAFDVWRAMQGQTVRLPQQNAEPPETSSAAGKRQRRLTVIDGGKLGA